MYEFTEDCMLHIDAIDEEHKRLFQMINEAFELVEKTEDVTAIGQSLIANLKDYAATHLAHEEAYMESIHDPELPLQKTEHAAFAKTINEFKLDTTSPRNAKRSLNELLTYLVHWLYHHILSSDMMIGKMIPTEESTEDPFAFRTNTKPASRLSMMSTASCLRSSVIPMTSSTTSFYMINTMRSCVCWQN